MADVLDKDFEKITLKKIGAYLGAEVSGADLSAEVDDVTFSEIHQAFVENEVLVFRDL
ncbi:MAG TPA: TauD/TfdA family dioxygenase, partial [Rhodospirillales bacterium]|nr:TauD/TfdA family dioxygenase [Rhodospirillales bacterium]